MNRPESIKGIAKALLKIQSKMGVLQETAENSHFRNTYLPISGLIRAIQPVLQDAGVAYTQTFIASDPDRVNIVTTLIHAESGEYISSELTLPLSKASAQDAGSAITYGRRYSLAAILGLATDKDDDGEGASGRDAKGEPSREKSNGRARGGENAASLL